jgi:hypothetical protein
MANKEHLDILVQGIETWNQWRIDNSAIRPDLSFANLTGMDLKGAYFIGTDLRHARFSLSQLQEADCGLADLQEADLQEADLRKSNLSGANLRGANLCKANLEDADLSSTELSGADLSEASLDTGDLSEANLSRANLFRARFRRARLPGAILRQANLEKTNFTGANLRGADLREVSWLFVMELTLQPGVQIAGIQWDRREAAGAEPRIFLSQGDVPSCSGVIFPDLGCYAGGMWRRSVLAKSCTPGTNIWLCSSPIETTITLTLSLPPPSSAAWINISANWDGW